MVCLQRRAWRSECATPPYIKNPSVEYHKVSQSIEVTPDTAPPIAEAVVHPGDFHVPLHFIIQPPVRKATLPALVVKVIIFCHGLLAVVEHNDAKLSKNEQNARFATDFERTQTKKRKYSETI